MGCCGGKGKIAAVGRIIKGNATRSIHEMFFVDGELYKDAHKRMEICQTCEHHTWMTKADYVKWLAGNGIKVVKHLDELTALPPLKKQPFEKGRSLFCRLCKCWIPGKAYSKDSECPENKW